MLAHRVCVACDSMMTGVEQSPAWILVCIQPCPNAEGHVMVGLRSCHAACACYGWIEVCSSCINLALSSRVALHVVLVCLLVRGCGRLMLPMAQFEGGLYEPYLHLWLRQHDDCSETHTTPWLTDCRQSSSSIVMSMHHFAGRQFTARAHTEPTLSGSLCLPSSTFQRMKIPFSKRQTTQQ